MRTAVRLTGFPEPEAIFKMFYPYSIPALAMRIWLSV